eukprot:4305908-Lingulodinium_polyedra.AAC.1
MSPSGKSAFFVATVHHLSRSRAPSTAIVVIPASTTFIFGTGGSSTWLCRVQRRSKSLSGARPPPA